MVSQKVVIKNPTGLHLRPAGVLSQAAMKFKCDITIQCGEKKIVAKSVLNVMAAGIKKGTEITLICDGVDEEEALVAKYKGEVPAAEDLRQAKLDGFSDKYLSQILEIPEDYRIELIVSIGYPKGEPRCPARPAVEEIAFFNSFGEAGRKE